MFDDFNILSDVWYGYCDVIAFDGDGKLVRICSRYDEPTVDQDTGLY